MKTAQEVGGDYYDFYLDDDQITFAIGDATGHGLKAGTIVTATKALFNFFARLDNPKEILSKISRSLKEMGFKNMYMAMLVAKISKKKMEISSAGIPFTYIYQHADQTVKEIPLKGMPLGSFLGFTYHSRIINLNKGDTFLFHSDGLSECFNEKGEIFGESRIKSLFEKVALQAPANIIKQLNEAAKEWMGSGQLNDDMTLVVMMIKK
jgi:serine phosphatase RsbU (regulator of sigma subunit)